MAEGDRTVLAVDDEPDLLEAIRRVLTRRGHAVLCASNAADALHVCRTHDGRIDLLLTDVRMPGGAGTELAAEAERLRPGIAVLYMSGYADASGFAGTGELYPPDAPVVGKPFTPQTLVAAVEAVLPART